MQYLQMARAVWDCNDNPADEILHTVDLSASAQKQIRYYSSGMKQRLKLGIAFFSHTPALLLDEPTSNLDANGIALYHQLIKKYSTGRIVIISSNDKNEYEFCNNVLKMEDYKEAGAGLSTKY